MVASAPSDVAEKLKALEWENWDCGRPLRSYAKPPAHFAEA